MYVLEGAAVRLVRQAGLAQPGEELQRRELLQVEGRLCDELLEPSQDAVRQGAERCVGDVPSQTNMEGKTQ